MIKSFRIICVFLLQIYGSISYAGGPLAAVSLNGGTAVTYQDSNITLHIENGDLGGLSNAVAVTLMQEAFELWNSITTSSINLNLDQTQIALDIDHLNYQVYLPNETDNLNPIIFDSDGKIIDEYLGNSQSDLILGFAESIVNTATGHFIEGSIVLNGKITGRTNTEIKLTFAHEAAHFFGLDHSQNDINNQESFFDLPLFCFTTNSDNYPLMYPVSCRENETLHADDISAASALYPAANVNDSFGILNGQFFDESGNAILGANIWAENTTTGEIVSIVSDYLKQGTGYYKLYLPPGMYTLHANSINTEFTAGSGVGPYSLTSSDISFTEPHPIAEVTYHGSNEANDEVISIMDNQAVAIDFASTGALIVTESSNESEDDSWRDLFGATSHITLLIMAGLLVFGRLITKPKSA